MRRIKLRNERRKAAYKGNEGSGTHPSFWRSWAFLFLILVALIVKADTVLHMAHTQNTGEAPLGRSLVMYRTFRTSLRCTVRLGWVRLAALTSTPHQRAYTKPLNAPRKLIHIYMHTHLLFIVSITTEH